MDLNKAKVKSFNIGINDINNVQTEDEVNQGSILGYVSSTNDLESLNNEHTVFQFEGNTIENAYVILQNLGLSHAADILKESTESQGESSSINFLELASGALLCEPLTDDIQNRVDWVELNKISEVEDENSKDILRIIENHADKLMKITMKKYFSTVKIFSGEYEKSSHALVTAPSETLAIDYSILMEAHDQESLEWDSHNATDLGGEFMYHATAKEIPDCDYQVLSKYLPSLTCDVEELHNSGNYLPVLVVLDQKAINA